MEDELDTIISSFVFTLMAIKGLKPVADKVGLLDVPNHRKHHKGAVPLIGGLSIFLGVAVSALLFMSLDAQQKVLLAAWRCSLYVLVTVFTPPNNHDFASSLCCSRTRNHAK